MSEHDTFNKRIGKYQLQQLLGKSDLSEVYTAEHIDDHHLVAIKLLYGRWDEAESNKFFAHATTMAKLQHPHIMPLLDFGIDEEGRAFMVMNYAPKGTLRHLHPRGTRVSLETIVNYVNQIASALSYLHEQGLVHRDIKPHNLLMDANDQIMLIDFGAVIISHSIQPIAASQREFEGTVPYAAPEQLRGKPRRNSDQYALGIMVYEWVTGNWPFDGSFHEMTHQHLFVPPPRFQERNIICPTNIEQVIRRTLEKDPAKRFPGVKNFADELEWACKVAQARGQTLMFNNLVPEISPTITITNTSSSAAHKDTPASIPTLEKTPLIPPTPSPDEISPSSPPSSPEQIKNRPQFKSPRSLVPKQLPDN